jgi:hypothetical protein
MSVRFTCPHCQVTINAPGNAAGKRRKCPKCGLILEVPVPRGEVIESGPATQQRSLDWREEPPPVRQGLPATTPAPTMLPAVPPPEMVPPVGPAAAQIGYGVALVHVTQEDRSDPFGVISLIIGVIAVVSLPLACCTYGLSLIASGFLGALGGGLAFLAKGNLRTAGLMLNALAFAPALIGGLILVGMVILGGLAQTTQQSPPPSKTSPRFGNEAPVDWNQNNRAGLCS